MRAKQVFGFQTGDRVRANVPKGKKPGATQAVLPYAPRAISTSRLPAAWCKAFRTGIADSCSAMMGMGTASILRIALTKEKREEVARCATRYPSPA